MNLGWPDFIFQLQYLFTHLTLADVIDISLVGGVFFIILQALRLRRALQLLQGAIVFAILGVALLLLLPLTTFSWLMRGLLLASLIALPVLFQDELRQALTGLGQFGRRSRGVGSAFDQFKAAILHSTRIMSDLHIGALIVLEGETPLTEVIETGIPIRASQLTQELLVTLFNPNTPLHDGAVILRGNELLAAGCILPVQTEATGATHLGTRHRAALGISAQIPDVMVIVVSEETGRISVAKKGLLYTNQTRSQLEEWLDEFQDQLTGGARSNWQGLLGGGIQSIVRNLGLAFGLAVIAWVSVVYQTDPPQQTTLTDVPLTLNSPSQDLVLMTGVPKTVQVDVQTTQEGIAGLDAGSVRANIDLSALPAGVARAPVQVTLADPQTQVVSITPAFIDVTLEPRQTITLTPTIRIVDLGSVPAGYAVGRLSSAPEVVTVQGPQSLVEQVSSAQADLNLEGRFTDFQETLALDLLDSSGELVAGLSPNPESVLVSVPVRRTFFTREVGVQIRLNTDTLEPGYGVQQVNLSPTVVTLIGERGAVEGAGDFLATAPISLTGVFSDLILDVPLILPTGVSALNPQGESINTVLAQIEVAAVTGYLVLDVTPTPVNLPESVEARFQPGSVSVLVIGPEPLIAAVRADPELVEVTLDLVDAQPGTFQIPLTVSGPDGLSMEAFPAMLAVTIEVQ